MAKRILIVDDSPLILQAAQHVLRQAGYAVDIRSGVEDLGERGGDGFDLILMDVQMPELFGDDVAGIMKHDRGVGTPIYLFSTLSTAELGQRARDARVDGFISKDGGLDHLVAEVRRILG
ncbi:MAG TPA: response regulator [Kofleriaceae bacterium]